MRTATKTLLAGVCWLAVFPGFTASGRDAVYKKVDDALNDRVRADVMRHFASGGEGVAALFKEFCVCMPRYWNAIKGRVVFHHAELQHMKTLAEAGRLVEAQGMALKDAQDMAALGRQLGADAGKTPAIRKLTEPEIKQLLEVLPIGIEEPVFVLENGARKFVVIMGEDDHTGNYFIVFVDEISRYGSPAGN